jgi:hypothetical protein
MAPAMNSLPVGYRLETGSPLEEAAKANVAAVLPLAFPPALNGLWCRIHPPRSGNW